MKSKLIFCYELRYWLWWRLHQIVEQSTKKICFKGIDLISEQFCWFWYVVCHRNIVAVIMTMRAITYQWSRNFVSFSSFLLVVAIDKLYRDTKKISTNSQLYNPNLSALIFLFRKEVGTLCHFFVTYLFLKKKKVRCT